VEWLKVEALSSNSSTTHTHKKNKNIGPTQTEGLSTEYLNTALKTVKVMINKQRWRNFHMPEKEV
jgi:hypothetical protein